MSEERLQKLIARSGLCSRREAEQWIRDGRVTVNGRTATIGDKADPETDHIKIGGKALRPAEIQRYLVMYKPRGVMTTCEDPEERVTVIDIVRDHVSERVFPVGRLDYHSEGLLILTNDGDLAAKITHPRYGVVREYHVKVRGELTEPETGRLLRGTRIEGRHVKPISAVRERGNRSGTCSWWRVQIAEGRTHEVRELFYRAGHSVQRLRRTAIGPIRDETLRAGDVRPLNQAEVAALRKVTAGAGSTPSGSPQAPRRHHKKTGSKTK